MRRAALLAVLSLALAPSLVAQAPFVEKIEVNIVNVDVTVTDRHGQPVRGLTRDDFEILEDGVPQLLTNFYAVDESANATADSQPDPRFRRKVLVLIDKYSMSPYNRQRALIDLEAFVDDKFRAGEYDWSIAAVDQELQMLLPPTSDKAAIHNAIAELRKGNVPRLPFESNQPLAVTPAGQFFNRANLLEQARSAGASVHSIIDATRAFGATEGKKIILLLSGQLLPSFYGFSVGTEFAKWLTQTRDLIIHEANAAGVSIYILNPEGFGGSSMYWVARETGGRLMNNNRIAQSLKQFDLNSSSYYSLGFKPAHGADHKNHNIKVRVKKEGYFALQYRDGYTNLPDDVRLARTFDSPFGPFMVTGATIPVSLDFGTPRDTGDAYIVPMKTIVPATSLVFLPDDKGTTGHVDIYVSAFDAAGKNVRYTHERRVALLGKTDEQSGTFVETSEMYFVKGKPYRVVVAVRDDVAQTVGVVQQIVQY